MCGRAWGYTNEEKISLVCVPWAKAQNGKYPHKEMFPIYGGKFFVA
jgi:hypothetical protein